MGQGAEDLDMQWARETARAMTRDEAKAECQRWLDYLKRQEEKSLALQRIASERRAGRMTLDQARREKSRIDGAGVRVYDGARLADAVRVLIAE